MKKLNQLKTGAMLSYICLIASNMISILYTPIMLRWLGQSEYGLYNLSCSIIGYLGAMEFGIYDTIIRYTARYRATSDREGESNLRGFFIIIYLVLDMIILIIGLILIFNIKRFFSDTLLENEIERLKILMGLMIFNLVISLPGGAFLAIINAYEGFVFTKGLTIIRIILNPIIMIPLLMNGYKSVALTIVISILNIGHIVVNIYYCFHVLKIKIAFKKLDFSILKEVAGYSFFIFLNVIVNKIYWNTDQLILANIYGTAVVAVYSIGINFINYYLSFSSAISELFLPKISMMVANGSSYTELSGVFIKVGRIQFLIMSFILGGFLLIGKSFIRLWAGALYEQAYYTALIVMIPLIIPLIQNMGDNILKAKNMQKFKSIVCIFTVMLNIILSAAMAKIFGGIGCAFSTSICLIIENIIMNIYYHIKAKINILFFWENIIKMFLPIICSIYISFLIKNNIEVNEIVSLIITGAFFTFIFIVVVWYWVLNEFEKNLFSKPIKKIMKYLLKKELNE